jgi:hypothetical protein
MRCFLPFLPLIESWVKAEYEDHYGDQSKYIKELVNDLIPARALSYACVSHGLDPVHLIAVRYAMNFDQTVYNANSDTSKRDAKWLFELTDIYPLTKELMRTRMLGSIMLIYNTDTDEQPGSLLEDSVHIESADFGRSYNLKHKRASSMFI